LAISFLDAHAVCLRYGRLSVGAALNVDGWTNAVPSSSTEKLISSATQINRAKGLVLHKGELVRRSVAVYMLICSI
jgi:hypothetical protein